jgi:hypothetical protein
MTTVTSDDSSTTTGTSESTDPDTSSSTGEPAENVVVDFAQDPCDAAVDWINNLEAEIGCPSDEESKLAPNGYVFPATNVTPVMIQATDEEFTEGAVVMHPPYVADAFLFGRYPPFVYEDGDVFRARVWCVQEAICDVTVMLGSSLKQSDPFVIGTWPVTFADVDGVEIEIDLIEAGVPVGLAAGVSLMVASGPTSGSDAVLWERPRVVRPE